MNTPEPGVYEDVPADEYHSWNAVSNSRLSLLHQSPMHYLHGGKEQTQEMRFGTLVHSGLLEPASIPARYKVMPSFHLDSANRTKDFQSSTSRSTAYVKDRVAEFFDDYPDFEIVDQEKYDEMTEIVAAISEHDLAKKFFRKGQTELSIVWDDVSGFRCKCRIDWLTTQIVADFKTTGDVASFERTIAKFGYHRQMVFYMRGLEAVGLGCRVPWLIAADKKSPIGIRCAPMDEDALVVGRREINQLLARLAECHASGEWPGYESPRSWCLPQWYSELGAVELVINGEQFSV